MDEYRGNSRLSKSKDKEDNKEVKKEKVEKIIKGTAKVKKKNGFFGMFTGDMLDIRDYVIQDVLIPAVKNTIEDIVTNGISMLLNNGETRKGSKRSSSSSRISYRAYYEREDNERDRDRRRDRGYSYDDVTLDSRAEAEEVIARLDELIDVYGMASVADLYDLVGISGQYTDNKYGWTDVRSASHVRVRDGYLLKMPRAKPL
jgi:hypothetical protein